MTTSDGIFARDLYSRCRVPVSGGGAGMAYVDTGGPLVEGAARRPSEARLGGLRMSAAKEELIQLVEGQPEDSSREGILRELLFYIMVQRGLGDSDGGRVITDDEMGRRIRSGAG